MFGSAFVGAGLSKVATGSWTTQDHLALVVDLLVRLTAFWGAFTTTVFYVGNWSVEHGFVNSDLDDVLD